MMNKENNSMHKNKYTTFLPLISDHMHLGNKNHPLPGGGGARWPSLVDGHDWGATADDWCSCGQQKGQSKMSVHEWACSV